ncbi:hypothetical protein ACFL3T_02315 [Patescibacteria group bacterium]
MSKKDTPDAASEARADMSEFLGTATRNNSGQFSPELIQRVEAELATGNLNQALARNIYASTNEQLATEMLEAILEAIERAKNIEAIHETCREKMNALLLQYKGDLTAEEDAELREKVEQIEAERNAELAKVTGSTSQVEATDNSKDFDPYVLEQIQELEAKGFLPNEVADVIRQTDPADALKTLNEIMGALLVLSEQGEEYKNLEQLEEAVVDSAMLKVSFTGGCDADSGRYAELEEE